MANAASGSRGSGRRVALVIGNSAYRLGPPLANPQTDAVAISEALARLDFDPVHQYLDLDKSGHDRALKQFAVASKNAEMALIYYAGHGMELDGENYLIPVDAELADVRSLGFEATRLSDIMRGVEGAERFRFVILDACRDNPFRRQMQGIEATRSIMSRGLSAPPDLSGNTLVAYAARPGTQAKDGKRGSNSPFAAAILKHIETANTDVRIIIGRIRDEVWEATQKQQEPAFYGSMGGAEVQLKHVASVPPPADALLDAGTLVKALEEERDWEKAQRADSVEAYDTFRTRWGTGRFAEQASAKIEEIKEAQAYAKAKEANGLEGLRSFVKNWPQGKFAETARELLEKKGAETAWTSNVQAMTRTASSDDKFSAEVLRNFIAQYSRSPHLDEVKKKLAAAEREQEAALSTTHSRAAWERYLKNWPQGSKRAEAQRLLDGGGDDRLWIEVQKDKSASIVERYLADWPKGRHADEAAILLKRRKAREKGFDRFAMVFTMAILGCMVLGILGFLYAAVPYVWNNGWSILNMVREKAAEVIRPQDKKDASIDPVTWPRDSTFTNPLGKLDSLNSGKSLSTLDGATRLPGSATVREANSPPTQTPTSSPGLGGGSGLDAHTFTFPSSTTTPSAGINRIGTGTSLGTGTTFGTGTTLGTGTNPGTGSGLSAGTGLGKSPGTLTFPPPDYAPATGVLTRRFSDPFQFNGDQHQPSDASPPPPAK